MKKQLYIVITEPKYITYTVADAFKLPVPDNAGSTFLGWYTTSSFKVGTKVDMIGPGTTGNKTLYAKFQFVPTT